MMAGSMIHSLDQPEILRVLFHPRKEYVIPFSTSEIRIVTVDVEPGVMIAGRFYFHAEKSPTIIFFHGNGEIARDYDEIARFYRQIGVNLLVWDYRGYGLSTGSPTAGNLLLDAKSVFSETVEICRQMSLKPDQIFVMGRSLGSAAAIEIAMQIGKDIAGLIIESGFSDTFALLARLGLYINHVNDELIGFNNLEKIGEISIPTLFIHGDKDVLIPSNDSQQLFDNCKAESKKLVLIPGGHHNDLIYVGSKIYFDAIKDFINS
jgi:alpha-beta hydrolase superfamily lysophospholipase